MTERRSRSFALTPELLRAYSRRGNFHSDPSAAAAIGLSGLVAQGMQAAAPAYGLHFVAPVLGGETVHAAVDVDGDAAQIEVTAGVDDVRVVGRARRRA